MRPSRRSKTPSPRSATDGHAQRYRLLAYRESAVRSYPLEGTRWVIGRAEDCDIVLADTTISRHHLVLERHGDRFHFRDLGGTNATLANGRPLREGDFSTDVTLLIGMTRLVLERIRTRAPVRLIADPRHTQAVGREVLEEAATGNRAPAAGTPGPAVPAELLQQLAERMVLPLAEIGTPAQAAAALLEMVLEHTGRNAGLIGLYESTGRLALLASANLAASGAAVLVPKRVLRDAETLQQPQLLWPGLTNERVLIPLGPGPSALVVLQDARPQSPTGQALLRLCRALGALVWARLEETSERTRLREQVQRLQFAASAAPTTLLASARLRLLRKQLSQAAAHRLGVHLRGESGTEREELARYLHSQASESAGSFVPFYAGIVPPSRLEQELLGGRGEGHEPGQAGPLEETPGGAILRAHAGTLFLDQPELLPASVQARLAMTLARGVLAVPGTQLELPVHTRLVAASEQGVDDNAAGTLCPELAELFAIRLELPPLRSQPADVLTLAELVLAEMGPGGDGGPRTLTEPAKQCLLRYHWPGNVRELRRVLERAAALAGQRAIAPRHLPAEVRSPSAESPAVVATLAETEKQHILRALDSVGHNRRKAAAVLGIALSTLYAKLERYGYSAP